MNHPSPSTAAVAFVLLLGSLVAPNESIAQARASTQDSTATQTTVGLGQAHQALAQQRPAFIENRGQWDPRAKFLLRSPGLDLWITSDGVVYDMRRFEPANESKPEGEPQLAGTAHASTRTDTDSPALKVTRVPVFVTYQGASTNAAAIGAGKQPEYHNYFLGNDRSKWAEHVPLYSDARVQGLYHGIDAVFYLDNGRPRYDLVVAPGVDPAVIRMKIDGASRLSVAADGSLQMATELGLVQQRELFAYQENRGRKQKVACRFTIGDDGGVGFDVGSYDRSRPLVIDPIIWSTFLGGDGQDRGSGIAVDGNGNAYVAGTTHSTANFPTLDAMQGSNAGAPDAFISKFTTSGALSYSTFFGGSSHDEANGIAVAANGSVYITGGTESSNLPTINAMQPSKSGGNDAFVAKLASSGSLEYSTYLGGLNTHFFERALAIAVDGSGNAYVAGFTPETVFPGADGTATSGFMTKLTSSGGLSFSKYIAADPYGITVDESGNIYVVGGTFNDNSGVARNVFVMKLTSEGTDSYSVTYGGSSNEWAEDIGVDSSGNAYVVGTTESSDFPTLNAQQPDAPTPTGANNPYNAIVMKLNPSGEMLYSTYLGGGGQEFGNGIAVDADGNTVVVGGAAPSFPTTAGACQPDNAGAFDPFVVMYTPNGVVNYATYIGGGGHDHAQGVAIDGSGEIFITGYTGAPFGGNTTFYPTLNAAQETFAGTEDAFVSKLSPCTSISSISVGGGTRPSTGIASTGYLLMPNHPNPYGTMTTIEYRVPHDSKVSLVVYDTRGRQVATIVDRDQPAGTHRVVFDGSELPSGTYAYVLRSNGVVMARTMMLER